MFTILNDNIGCTLSGEMVAKGFVLGKPATSSQSPSTLAVAVSKKSTPSTIVKKQITIDWGMIDDQEYLAFLEEELLF